MKQPVAVTSLGWILGVAAATVIPGQAAAQAALEEQSSNDACANLPPALAAEAEAWRRPARALRASAAPEVANSVQLFERVTLTLGPEGAMKAMLTPGERPPGDGFGGFVAFRSTRAGAYRILLDDRAWIEVTNQKLEQPALAIYSDKRLRCFGVGKNLAFELKADTLYLVQLSGASRPGVGLLVSTPIE
jgi:hypothetical protein